MKITSLEQVIGLATSLLNIVKGAAYINKDGKTISLADKDQVASSKKETRDACSIILREEVPKARFRLNKLKTDKETETIVFTCKEWVEFVAQICNDTKFIVTQISASNRAGITAEGALLLALEEVGSNNLLSPPKNPPKRTDKK